MSVDPTVSTLGVPLDPKNERIFKVRTQCPACGHAYESFVLAGHIKVLEPHETPGDPAAVKAALKEASEAKPVPPPEQALGGPKETAAQAKSLKDGAAYLERQAEKDDDAKERDVEDKAESAKQAKKGKR
jgi:hypothetical protein